MAGAASLPAPLIDGCLWPKVSPRFPFALTAMAALLCTTPVWFKLRVAGGEDAAQEVR